MSARRFKMKRKRRLTNMEALPQERYHLHLQALPQQRQEGQALRQNQSLKSSHTMVMTLLAMKRIPFSEGCKSVMNIQIVNTGPVFTTMVFQLMLLNVICSGTSSGEFMKITRMHGLLLLKIR
jgi:hypothetical protein